MSTKDTGGWAFPVPNDANCNGEEGMTLRDYFATRAPMPDGETVAGQRLYDKNRNPYNESHKPKLRDTYEIIADLAYEYADAMLEARK